MKILIVEDMATYRTIISRAFGDVEDIEIVGKVSNGKKALDFLEENEVDLITLDVEMPIMDGLETLKELRKRKNRAEVVMLSGLSDQAAQLTIQCLQLGAIDFVLKPQGTSFVENQKQLADHLEQIVKSIRRKVMFRRPGLLKASRDTPSASHSFTPTTPTPTAPSPTPTVRKRRRSGFLPKPKMVLIGISTGGPKALSEVFDALQGPLPFPILIVQHMPPKFTKSLADSLNRKSDVEVVEASDGDLAKENTAYIAPGGYHMVLERDDDFGFVLGTNLDPPVNSCRPSADVLFMSAGRHFKGGELVVIVMTGMGRDGADGAEALGKKGAYVVSQSAESCTIYGMPKAVEDMGIQDEVLDLDQIAPFLMKLGKPGIGSR